MIAFRPAPHAPAPRGSAVAALATRPLPVVGLLLAGLLGTTPLMGWAATPQDEDACRPDVFRLCASAIPDESAIVACLGANLQNLGAACRAVIDPPAASAPRPERRRKAAS